jgi:hypothetical protein
LFKLYPQAAVSSQILRIGDFRSVAGYRLPATNGPCCDATSTFHRLCQRIAQIPLKKKITGRERLTVLQTWFPDPLPLKPPESGAIRAQRAWERRNTERGPEFAQQTLGSSKCAAL